MPSPAWSDGFFADRVADPEQAYEDAKEAHGYVTAELEAATDPRRMELLTAERKRLAGIAWALKRQF